MKINSLTNLIKSSQSLIFTKLTAMVLAVLVYSYFVLIFSSDYAVSHASIMLIFGIFKAGGGFEAISTGKSAYQFVKRSLIKRVLIVINVFYIFSYFFENQFTVSLIIGLLVALIWLHSFDAHIKGKYLGSFFYSLNSVIVTVALGIFYIFEINDFIRFEIQHTEISLISSFCILIFLLITLKKSAEQTLSEMLHSSISPLMIFILSSNYQNLNDEIYIIYKGFEATAQILLFILSSALGRQLPVSNIIHLSVCMFIPYLVVFMMNGFFGKYFDVLFYGILIVSYFLASFFIVRDHTKLNIYFIILFLFVLLILSINSLISKYIVFILPITLFILYLSKKKFST